MKYLIMHGHFYQPPRENPFLGIITREPSAVPAHDWNERVTNECYSPNAYSRVLDGYGRITEMVNNYEFLSFNFGPTLLDYIAEKRKDILEKILEADKKSIERLGYGNAMAQVYNHIILPLANKEDMRVQIKWGMYNFEKYFKRKTSGMWLSETAINIDVVDALYDCGIKFTVLSPYQAHYIKKDDGSLVDVSSLKIDTSKPYWLYGNNGKKVAVFFYDGELSRAIAFEHLLTSAEKLATRINNEYRLDREMINIATDGESYGHHEAFGDMCLAKYFLDNVHYNDIIVTNYEHYLNLRYPVTEVILHEGKGKRGTSWSCSHGVERWRSDCGCGGREGYNLSWREPLREAFDILRAMQDRLFSELLNFTLETRASLREQYVAAMYDNNSAEDLYAICRNHISYQDFMFLMEAYKYSLFSYTSCGWFFDDVSRIEPKQNMQYAERSFYYARALTKDKYVKFVDDTYNDFINMLSKSVSNALPHHTAKYYFEQEYKEDLFSELYVINHAMFMLFSDASTMSNMKIYDYNIQINKIENGSVEGAIIHKYNIAHYFKIKSFEENFELKNNIQIASSLVELDEAKVYTLSLKDVVVDVRDSLADSLFGYEVKAIEDACNSIIPYFENLFLHYKSNNLMPSYDYKRIMGSIYSPILRNKIQKFGRDSYEEISKELADIRLQDIFISTSGISNIIGTVIKKSLNEIENTGNSKLFEDVLKDIKFLTVNNMPIERHTFENIFYRIILKYKNNNIIMNEIEKINFIELGNWLNFNMEVFDYKDKILPNG